MGPVRGRLPDGKKGYLRWPGMGAQGRHALLYQQRASTREVSWPGARQGQRGDYVCLHHVYASCCPIRDYRPTGRDADARPLQGGQGLLHYPLGTSGPGGIYPGVARDYAGRVQGGTGAAHPEERVRATRLQLAAGWTLALYRCYPRVATIAAEPEPGAALCTRTSKRRSRF